MTIENDNTPPLQRSASIGKLLVVLLFGIALGALVLWQVIGINGSSYWLWPYRRIDWWRIYPSMLLAAAPFFLLQVFTAKSGNLHIGRAIACMMISTFAMQVIAVGMTDGPYDLGRIVRIVRDEESTSYFTDAALVSAQPSLGPWLDDYDNLLQYFTFHSREKPPGPILYYVIFLRIFGPTGEAALLGGLTIGLLSTLSVPATYFYTRIITGDSRASLYAAAYFSLCPSLVLIFPMFDSIYPTFACAILGFWVIALRDNRYWASALFGAILSLAIFFSYALLVLGAFVVCYGLVQIARKKKAGLQRFTIHSIIALGTVAGVYFISHLATGFDPIATFQTAVKNQQKLLADLVIARPYPWMIPGDLQDFFLGSAWISLPLMLFWMLRRNREEDRKAVWVGLIQIFIVALTGLLPGETARVWMFLQPLAMVPIGLELSGWGAWQRFGVYSLLWLLTTIIGQNMLFVMPP